MPGRNDPVSTAAREITLMRIFDAPRALVFAAWTEERHCGHWRGPRGFTSTTDRYDLRPGGAYRICLHAPDGAAHWLRGTFREIVPPQRLVMTHQWERADGSVSPETLVTVTFAALGKKTKMIFHQGFFTTDAARDGHEDGWSQSFERLARHLAAAQSAPAATEVPS